MKTLAVSALVAGLENGNGNIRGGCQEVLREIEGTIRDMRGDETMPEEELRLL
ncbi:MAG TPA: hypothetical protein PK280_12450 [Planctomycetota bacterium]|nr:hypothetical protein [Planctomycetota bacterium]